MDDNELFNYYWINNLLISKIQFNEERMKNINNNKRPVVLFDTNFFLLPEQFKIDIFEQSKELLNTQEPIFIIFDKTINELEKLTKTNSKHSLAAKIGMLLLKKQEKSTNNDKLIIVNTNNETNYVDKLIIYHKNYLNIENYENFYIATQDKSLKLKLKEENTKLIVLAQKKILKFA